VGIGAPVIQVAKSGWATVGCSCWLSSVIVLEAVELAVTLCPDATLSASANGAAAPNIARQLAAVLLFRLFIL
jgi:hypothetical protein